MQISVLIVDDHTVVRDGLQALLAAHPDITVLGGAATGFQAVSLVKELHPDVVVMDISMPDLNGIDATQQILQSDPNVGVIILSMLSTSDYVFRALQAGARGYLLKESAGREVIEAVLDIAAGKRYFSQPIADKLVTDFIEGYHKAPEQSPLERLSLREREILQLVVQGMSSAEIGESLHLSPKTVESYRSRMMQKLDIPDFPHLVLFAIREGLLPMD